MVEQVSEFPLFSPIPWASAAILNDRYSSPPADDPTGAATVYPVSNGVNSDHDADVMTETTEPSNPTVVTIGTPPPIDAVDVGIVPEALARAVQEAGPPPRSPEDLNVSVEDNNVDPTADMDVE